MLRRRIEKLELKLAPAGDLLEQWERRALACLSSRDRTLVAEINAATRRPPQSEAHIEATGRYQEALAQTIQEVSDGDLDQLIARIERFSPGALP